jgi:hypothetical protein
MSLLSKNKKNCNSHDSFFTVGRDLTVIHFSSHDKLTMQCDGNERFLKPEKFSAKDDANKSEHCETANERTNINLIPAIDDGKSLASLNELLLNLIDDFAVKYHEKVCRLFFFTSFPTSIPGHETSNDDNMILFITYARFCFLCWEVEIETIFMSLKDPSNLIKHKVNGIEFYIHCSINDDRKSTLKERDYQIFDFDKDFQCEHGLLPFKVLIDVVYRLMNKINLLESSIAWDKN